MFTSSKADSFGRWRRLGISLSVCTMAFLALPVHAALSTEDFLNDMVLPSQALPHGVPVEWGWPAHPLMQAGNKPNNGGNRILPWFQVYEAVSGNQATNTRVEIRTLYGRFLSKSKNRYSDGYATPLKQVPPGALYPENFQGVSLKNDFRLEPDGGFSTKPGLLASGQRVVSHGWTQGMMAAPVADMAGLVVTFQARLVVDDPAKPDDRAVARYVASAGADFWRAPKYDNNEGIAIGRFKLVTKDWQTFSVSTLTGAQLQAFPPCGVGGC